MERKTLYKCIGISVSAVVLIVVIILLFAFLFSDNSELIPPGAKLVIDHDGGADDAMAIFLALLYEKYFNGPKIVGLTTNHGNVEEKQAFINTQRFLDIAQRRDIPIYRGSSHALVKDGISDYYYGVDGLGDLEDVVYVPTKAQPEHAVTALIEMSKKFEGKLTVAVIGPATNVALAIKLDRDFISRISHLYIAAGNINNEAFQKAEFNAQMDVEAYHIVTQNAVRDKVTFIPFSPFREKHNISMDWRLNVLGAIDTQIMQALNQFQRISNNGSLVYSDLDPCAMAIVLNRTLVEETRCTNNSIILCGQERGVTDNTFDDCENSNANVAFPAEDEKYKAFWHEVFSADINEQIQFELRYNIFYLIVRIPKNLIIKNFGGGELL